MTPRPCSWCYGNGGDDGPDGGCNACGLRRPAPSLPTPEAAAALLDPDSDVCPETGKECGEYCVAHVCILRDEPIAALPTPGAEDEKVEAAMAEAFLDTEAMTDEEVTASLLEMGLTDDDIKGMARRASVLAKVCLENRELKRQLAAALPSVVPDRERLKPRYSGAASGCFWAAVNALEGEDWELAYSTGVELQKLEAQMLRLLEDPDV